MVRMQFNLDKTEQIHDHRPRKEIVMICKKTIGPSRLQFEGIEYSSKSISSNPAVASI
jgi:hypothetical protein